MKYLSNALVLVALLGIGPATYASAQEPRAVPVQTVSAQDNNRDSIQDSTDWGWIGLVGLVGLAGLLKRRESEERHTVRSDAQPSTVR